MFAVTKSTAIVCRAVPMSAPRVRSYYMPDLKTIRLETMDKSITLDLEFHEKNKMFCNPGKEEYVGFPSYDEDVHESYNGNEYYKYCEYYEYEYKHQDEEDVANLNGYEAS